MMLGMETPTMVPSRTIIDSPAAKTANAAHLFSRLFVIFHRVATEFGPAHPPVGG
ncbi:hypothetical protein GCM10023166_37490 [Paeniglutamicibacter cryotolerans]